MKIKLMKISLSSMMLMTTIGYTSQVKVEAQGLSDIDKISFTSKMKNDLSNEEVLAEAAVVYAEEVQTDATRLEAQKLVTSLPYTEFRVALQNRLNAIITDEDGTRLVEAEAAVQKAETEKNRGSQASCTRIGRCFA